MGRRLLSHCESVDWDSHEIGTRVVFIRTQAASRWEKTPLCARINEVGRGKSPTSNTISVTVNGGRDAEDQQRGQFEKSLRKMCGSLLTILIPQWEYPSYSRSTCDKFVLCSSSWSSSPPSPSPPPPPSPSFPSSLPGSPYFYFQGNPVEKTFSLANQKETTFILAIVWDFLSLIPDKREVFKWFLICLLNQFSDVFSCCSDD